MEAGAARGRAGLAVMMEQQGFDPFPQRDLGFDVFFLSRPLLESLCRRRLEQEPNVELWPRSRVAELIPTSDRRGVAAIRFDVEEGKSEVLRADFVVDASGRAAPTLSLLERIDARAPDVTEIGIDQAYASAVFEIPADASRHWMGLGHLGAAPKENYGNLIFPMEHGRWIVSLGRVHGGPLPGEIEGFKAFAKAFRTPTFFDAIRGPNRSARSRATICRRASGATSTGSSDFRAC